MKIQIYPNHVAILQEENGEIVGVFKSSLDAKETLENAARSHFDYDVTLTDNRDFIQPWDYNQPYSFHVHDETEEGYYVTLYLTFAPIY